MPTDLPVYLLLGGKSKRFGSDKASHPINGKPWALDTGERLAQKGKLTLVGREQPALAELSTLPFVHDAEPAVGVLSGVVAAVRHCREVAADGLLVLASCDLVRPNLEWLTPLIEAHQQDKQLEVAAYVAADRWQPFPSIIHTRWLERLEAHLASTYDHSLQSLFRQSKAEALPWQDQPWNASVNGPPQANTPEELHGLLSL